MKGISLLPDHERLGAIVLDSKIDRFYRPEDLKPLEGRLVGYDYYNDSQHRTRELVVVLTEAGERVAVVIRAGLEELPLRVDAGEKCRIESYVEGAVPRYRFVLTVSGARSIPLLLQHRDMLKRVAP